MNQIDKAIIAIEACLELVKSKGDYNLFIYGQIEAYKSALRILNKYKESDEMDINKLNEIKDEYVNKLKEREEKLIKCAEFYADEETQGSASLEFNPTKMSNPEDFGYTARKTLEEIKDNNEKTAN